MKTNLPGKSFGADQRISFHGVNKLRKISAIAQVIWAEVGHTISVGGVTAATTHIRPFKSPFLIAESGGLFISVPQGD